MTDEQKLKRISQIGEAVYELLELNQMQTSCIDGSGLLTHVLRQKGFPDVYPLTVNVMICNKPCFEWMKTRDIPKLTDAAALKAFDDAGCANYQIGKSGLQVSSDHWNGHLVVIIPGVPSDYNFMVDLTIVQAHKPEWGLYAPPLTKVVKNVAFLKGEEKLGFENNGTHFIYVAFPNDHSYLDGNNVFESPDLKDASEYVIKELKRRGVA